jgi:hypothetical protein
MEKISSAALKDFCMAMPICKAELSISVKMLHMQYRNLMDTDSMSSSVIEPIQEHGHTDRRIDRSA